MDTQRSTKLDQLLVSDSDPVPSGFDSDVAMPSELTPTAVAAPPGPLSVSASVSMGPARHSVRLSGSCETGARQEMPELTPIAMACISGTAFCCGCCRWGLQNSQSGCQTRTVKDDTICSCGNARTASWLGFCIDGACRTVSQGVRRLSDHYQTDARSNMLTLFTFDTRQGTLSVTASLSMGPAKQSTGGRTAVRSDAR